MNWDLIKPWASKVARNGLQVIGTALASRGYIQNGVGTDAFIGAGMTLAGLFWDWWVKAGAEQTAALLKKLTDTVTHKDAVKAAQVLPPAAAVDTPIKSLSVQSVTKVLILAFACSLFLAGGQAFAQTPKLTGNIVRDIASATGKPAAAPTANANGALASLDGFLNTLGQKIQEVEKDLADKVIADLNAAITDATNHNDLISLPCWQANLALAQALPAEWATPPALPIGIALSIQIQRDLISAITSNDPKSLKVACAALWGDQLQQITQVGLLFGVKVATGGLL